MAVRTEGVGTLQQIVDSWRTPGLILRADTSAELVNGSLCVASGLAQERLIGFGWLGAIHQADPGAAPSFWETRMSAGERFAAEIKLRRHDGSFCPVHVDAAPLGDGRWFLTTSELQRPVLATSQRVIGEDALHALLFEHAREAAFAWELEGRPRIVAWNRAAEQLYGYSVPDVVGRSPHVVLRTAFPLSLAHMEAVLRRDGRWSGELRHTSRDGTILAIDASLQLLRLGDGRSIVLESARDVTARRRDEHAALEANARLRLALAVTHMGIWEWHIASNRLYWSPEAYGIMGVDPTGYALTLDDFKRLVVPDDLARLWAIVERALADGPGYDCELRIVRGDGAVRWIHNRAIVDRDAAGAPTRLVGTVRDITQERELTERLAASEARFRMLANAMPQVAWICDATLHTEWVNDRFLELTGTTLAALQQQTWRIAVHPDDMMRLASEWPASSAGEARELELRLRCGAAYRWFLAHAVPVRDAAGAPARWLVTAMDIDGRKRMEAALRDSEGAARARADELATILAATPR